ncbi:hypothetical protein TNIN_91201, partial [Trichonephila inaurata madagascariensis]
QSLIPDIYRRNPTLFRRLSKSGTAHEKQITSPAFLENMKFYSAIPYILLQHIPLYIFSIFHSNTSPVAYCALGSADKRQELFLSANPLLLKDSGMQNGKSNIPEYFTKALSTAEKRCNL